jgi:hypothetical protein
LRKEGKKLSAVAVLIKQLHFEQSTLQSSDSAGMVHKHIEPVYFWLRSQESGCKLKSMHMSKISLNTIEHRPNSFQIKIETGTI